MSDSGLNPLHYAERENSGPNTLRKYHYQYHWALYEMIQSHDVNKSYVIFIEYHEDVLFADDIELANIKFCFNQVKTLGTKITPTNIVRSVPNKPSILGKMLQSCLKKPYSDLIDQISIVSTGGFSFKHASLSDKVNFREIEKGEFDKIEKKVMEECSIDSLPTNVYFEVPKLPQHEFQNTVIGSISRLVSRIHPNSHCDSGEIYRVLMDELYRKGEVTTQYKYWRDAVKYKGTSSITINTVINQFTEMKGEAAFLAELNRLCDELGYNSVKRKRIVIATRRFRTQAVHSRDITVINIKNMCDEMISSIVEKDGELVLLINKASANLLVQFSYYFTTKVDAEAAILHQFVCYE